MERHKYFIEKMNFIIEYLKKYKIDIKNYKPKRIYKKNFSSATEKILNSLVKESNVDDTEILQFSPYELNIVSNINGLNSILAYIDFKYNKKFHEILKVLNLNSIIIVPNSNNQGNQESALLSDFKSYQIENIQHPEGFVSSPLIQKDNNNNELSLATEAETNFESPSDDLMIHSFGKEDQSSYFQLIDVDFKTSEFVFQTSEFGFQTSDFGFQTSDFDFQTSDFDFQILNFKF